MQTDSLPADIDEPRRNFLQAALDNGYGYGLGDAGFQQQCNTEYPSLASTTYLDYAASAPPPISTIHRLSDSIATTLYSNPHSRSSSSIATSLEIEQCRGRVLEELFGLGSVAERSQWDVIFTSGATASLKLVGDAFPWHAGSKYCYLKQSHTSLVGVRGCALAHGAVVEAMDAGDMLASPPADHSTLFGYAAQCNATGQRLGLEYGKSLKKRSPKALILCDAAAYLATAVIDLASVSLEDAPDFIACSFYKIFGFPTGLGCLVVKRSSASFLLRNAFFGGGTIDAISVSSPLWSRPRRSLLPGPIHERFEDGTVPFLGIIALGIAMDSHRRLYKSQRHVSAHVSALLRFVTHELSLIKHHNGRPVVKQHCAFGSAAYVVEPGPIIGFSLLGPSSEFVGHVHLEQLANLNGFQIRTGGLCNTGVLSSALHLSDQDLMDEYARGRSCWDDKEFAGVGKDVGRPLGIARISLGASSTIDDVIQWVSFIRRYFVVSETVANLLKPLPNTQETTDDGAITLQTLMLYPIKSCAGQSLPTNSSWRIVPTGLLFDREWMLLDASSGRTLSQKQYPRMALVRPSVDLARQILQVCAPGMPDLMLSLDTFEDEAMSANVCADVVAVSSSGGNADEWFRRSLGSDALFIGYPGVQVATPISTARQSSVNQVNKWITEGSTHAPEGPVQPACFRANFLLGASTAPLGPFFEDAVDLLRIGTETFQVLARCRRCLMVCVNQTTGCKTKEPFNCLARKRKSPRGKIEFGVHLMWREDLSQEGATATVRVGDPVTFASLHAAR